MKVFLDTNVIIDFYDRRGEFYYPAAVLFDLANKEKIKILVSATTFVNAFFILRKTYKREELYNSMKGLASLCEITSVNGDIIRKCLQEECRDFEDGVQYTSALFHQADVIVTRNVKDFASFGKKVQTPSAFLNEFLCKDGQ